MPQSANRTASTSVDFPLPRGPMMHVRPWGMATELGGTPLHGSPVRAASTAFLLYTKVRLAPVQGGGENVRKRERPPTSVTRCALGPPQTQASIFGTHRVLRPKLEHWNPTTSGCTSRPPPSRSRHCGRQPRIRAMNSNGLTPFGCKRNWVQLPNPLEVTSTCQTIVRGHRPLDVFLDDCLSREA